MTAAGRKSLSLGEVGIKVDGRAFGYGVRPGLGSQELYLWKGKVWICFQTKALGLSPTLQVLDRCVLPSNNPYFFCVQTTFCLLSKSLAAFCPLLPLLINNTKTEQVTGAAAFHPSKWKCGTDFIKHLRSVKATLTIWGGFQQ